MTNALLLSIPVEENLWIRRSLFAKSLLWFDCHEYLGIEEGKTFIQWSYRIHSRHDLGLQLIAIGDEHFQVTNIMI